MIFIFTTNEFQVQMERTSPPPPLANSWAVQLVPCGTLLPQPPVQEKVLRIGDPREEHGHCHASRDGIPPVRVVRRVLALEELTANDARQVGAHDHNGHGDGSLFGRLCVERHPGGVDRVCFVLGKRQKEPSTRKGGGGDVHQQEENATITMRRGRRVVLSLT